MIKTTKAILISTLGLELLTILLSISWFSLHPSQIYFHLVVLLLTILCLMMVYKRGMSSAFAVAICICGLLAILTHGSFDDCTYSVSFRFLPTMFGDASNSFVFWLAKNLSTILLMFMILLLAFQKRSIPADK